MAIPQTPGSRDTLKVALLLFLSSVSFSLLTPKISEFLTLKFGEFLSRVPLCVAVFGLSHRWTLNKSPLVSPTVRLSDRPPICLSAHASAVASSERGTTQAIADEGAY